jgi:hypothetical protein
MQIACLLRDVVEQGRKWNYGALLATHDRLLPTAWKTARCLLTIRIADGQFGRYVLRDIGSQ